MNIPAAYVIANFGGPRCLDEVTSFLTALLTDQEVLRTSLPACVHRWLFSYVAKCRAKTISKEYKKMGGGSPIFADTEAIAHSLRCKVQTPILTFHRYLPSTHQAFIDELQKLPCGEIRVFPMFPQFTYATTGSIASFFAKNLSRTLQQRLRWIKSYPAHSSYINVMRHMLKQYMVTQQLKEKESVFLFSSHGLPLSFIATGDLYLSECQATFQAIMQDFPDVLGKLCFQSKFGPGEWIRPYTIDCCEQVLNWHQGRKNVIFVPMSFTSDHIETLCEIEDQYMPVIEKQGLKALRLPAMNQHEEWIEAIHLILHEVTTVSNQMLLRH